jgi:hypothetical protein
VSGPSASDPIQDAFRSGRNAGLSIAALAMSVVAFINVLGMEKSLLALTLALLALRGSLPTDRSVKVRGRVAVGLAVCHLLVVLAVLILFQDRLTDILHVLQSLG